MILGTFEKHIVMLKAYDPSKYDWKAELRKYRRFIELANYSLIYYAFQAASADDRLHEEERKNHFKTWSRDVCR